MVKNNIHQKKKSVNLPKIVQLLKVNNNKLDKLNDTFKLCCDSIINMMTSNEHIDNDYIVHPPDQDNVPIVTEITNQIGNLIDDPIENNDINQNEIVDDAVETFEINEFFNEIFPSASENEKQLFMTKYDNAINHICHPINSIKFVYHNMSRTYPYQTFLVYDKYVSVFCLDNKFIELLDKFRKKFYYCETEILIFIITSLYWKYKGDETLNKLFYADDNNYLFVRVRKFIIQRCELHYYEKKHFVAITTNINNKIITTKPQQILNYIRHIILNNMIVDE